MKKLVLGAFFLSLGTFAMAQQQASVALKKIDKPSTEQIQAKRMEKMKTELGLSDDQVTKISAINEEKMKLRKAYKDAATNEERVAIMMKIKEEGDSYNTKVKAVLSPDQFTKWLDLRKKEMGGSTERQQVEYKSMEKAEVSNSSSERAK